MTVLFTHPDISNEALLKTTYDNLAHYESFTAAALTLPVEKRANIDAFVAKFYSIDHNQQKAVDKLSAIFHHGIPDPDWRINAIYSGFTQGDNNEIYLEIWGSFIAQAPMDTQVEIRQFYDLGRSLARRRDVMKAAYSAVDGLIQLSLVTSFPEEDAEACYGYQGMPGMDGYLTEAIRICSKVFQSSNGQPTWLRLKDVPSEVTHHINTVVREDNEGLILVYKTKAGFIWINHRPLRKQPGANFLRVVH